MTDLPPAAELSEPLSLAGEAKLRAALARLFANGGYLTGCEQMNARLLATLDAERAPRTVRIEAEAVAARNAEIAAAVEHEMDHQITRFPMSTIELREARAAVLAIVGAQSAAPKCTCGPNPNPDDTRHHPECPLAASAAVDLPDRIVVGANGAYWRDYGTHYSMCPVSEDNDPVEPVAVYVRAGVTVSPPSGDPAAALAVARHFDEDAFACDFAGQTSINMPGVGTVIPIPALRATPAPPLDVESIARLFHETYERLAPSFGYETRRESAVPWDRVPENNRRLMVAVAGAVLAAIAAAEGSER